MARIVNQSFSAAVFLSMTWIAVYQDHYTRGHVHRMSLFRSALTVGGYTMVSRVLGFLREILTAAMLGAGPLSDAFFVALRLPNLFRSLFAEGAFAQAFVPIFSGTLARDGRPAALVFARDTFAVLLAGLCLFVLAGEAFTPAILRVVAPGFQRDPALFHLIVGLTRITFPYLLFISVVSFLGGMLNAVDRFAANAASASLLNVFLIAALLLVRPLTDAALAWAVSLSGVAQFAWLAVSCHRAGLLTAPRWPTLTPDVKALLRIMGPGVFGARRHPDQHHGVHRHRLDGPIRFGVLSVVCRPAEPASARRCRRRCRHRHPAPAIARNPPGAGCRRPAHPEPRPGTRAAADLARRPWRWGMAAHPLLSVLFERGAFGAREVNQVTPALQAYACGLPAFVLTRVMVTGFLARRDTLTPMKIAVGVVAINASLTVLLGVTAGFAHVGIAAATSICGWLNALSLIAIAHRGGRFRLDPRSRRALPRIAGAALAMGVLVWALGRALAAPLAGAAMARYAALTGLVAGGLLCFTALILLTGAVDWRELRRAPPRPA